MTARNDDARAVGTGPGTEDTNSQETRPDSLAFSADAVRFLGAMFPEVPPDQRVILCGFPGNPKDRVKSSWRPRAWQRGDSLPLAEGWNAYVCVSTFRRHPDGTWRRRREGFAAGHAVMVDDLGTKVPLEVIKALKPSALVETSPGNFQAWYFLATPITDQPAFSDLVDAFIEGQLMGRDPGMAGFNRVGRLPGFVNGKPEHGGWQCVMHSLDGELRYTPESIRKAFALRPRKVSAARARQLDDALHHAPGTHPALVRERIDAFRNYVAHLRRWGMLKTGAPDAAGWIEIRCPWRGDHTGRDDSGAAIRMPNEENKYHGAFRCHHGHCAGMGWRHLTDWIVDQVVEEVPNGRH